MASYQKYSVVFTSIIFIVLQNFKSQLFRIFVFFEKCNDSKCKESNVTTTKIFFEDGDTSSFLYNCLLINNFFAIFSCVSLAAWSDKHGRKLLMTLPLFGSFLSDIMMLIALLVPSNPNYVLMVSESVYGLCGGTVLMSMGCLSYVTDATDHRLRMCLVGLFIGLFNLTPICELLFQILWTPYFVQISFRTLLLSGIIARMVIVAFLFIHIQCIVCESVFLMGSYHGNPWRNLVTPINVSDTVNCIFKRRIDNIRLFIIVLNVVFILYCLALHGNIYEIPKYLREVFEWNYENIALFLLIVATCQALCLWFTSYCAHKFHIVDTSVALLGTISLSLSSFMMLFSYTEIYVIVAIILGIFSLLLPTSIICILSKLIERTETGSMYAGIGFLLLVTQLIALPSFQKLGQLTMDNKLPELIFLAPLGLELFASLIFIYLKHNISPDLLGHLYETESLSLFRRRDDDKVYHSYRSTEGPVFC